MPQMAKVSCRTVEDADVGCDEMRDIRTVFFRFIHDIRGLARVPLFDDLYSALAKMGNPLTSIVLASR